MAISERAGRPADPSILVDVDRLVAAYYERRPDPAIPAQRVAFGTSGHRGSSFATRSTRPTSSPPREAICRYRRAKGPMGRCSSGRDTARALRAGLPDRARGARRERRRRPRRRGDGYTPTPGDLARDPRPQPRPARAPRRRHRRHAVAQPARGRRLQVQPAQRRPGRHRRHRLDPGRGEPAARGSASRPSRRMPFERARAAASAHDFLTSYVERSRRGHRHGRDPRLRPAARRRPAGRRERRLLAGDRASATAST